MTLACQPYLVKTLTAMSFSQKKSLSHVFFMWINYVVRVSAVRLQYLTFRLTLI